MAIIWIIIGIAIGICCAAAPLLAGSMECREEDDGQEDDWGTGA